MLEQAPSGWTRVCAGVERGVLITALLRPARARERVIIRLRFFEEMTQSEIAARVGLSQMQVSRLIRHSLDRLRVLARG